MKNFESQLVESTSELERKNKLIENADHLGIDHGTKQNMIDDIDELNTKLEFLEKSSGLSSKEIELIYVNLSQEEALLEMKYFFDTLPNKKKRNVFNQNVKSFVESIKGYVNPKQIIVIAIGFILLTTNAHGRVWEGIDMDDMNKPDNLSINVGDIVNKYFADKEHDTEETRTVELSDADVKHINNIIKPKILKFFKGALGVSNAQSIILSKKNIDIEHIEGDPRLIMLFFDEPKSSEFLEEYLMRQADRGVLNESDIKILYEYFSTTNKINNY